MPCYPVISTQQQHVVYFTVINYDYNHKFEVMEASELYIDIYIDYFTIINYDYNHKFLALT